MVVFPLGTRVRFSATAAGAIVEDTPERARIRVGEVWEGSVMAVASNVEGRQIVTIKVDLLDGSRAVGMKEVYADAVSWEVA